MIREYNYTMGFTIDGIPIPDPSAFSGADSALDASGERDATGLLHRDLVAEKNPVKIEYNALDWTTMSSILRLLKGKEFFTFTYPDPCTQGLRTMTAYAGDRDWNVVFITQLNEYVGSLKFSVLEQ